MRDKWDLQAIADCLQRADKRVEFLQAVENLFEQAKHEVVRHPTHTGHFGRRCTNATVGTASQAGFCTSNGETYDHLGDYSEQHLHARHRLMTLNWHLRSMCKTVRNSPKEFPGIGVAESTERWKEQRSTQIDAAAGREGDRCPQTSLPFTCLDLAPNKKR